MREETYRVDALGALHLDLRAQLGILRVERRELLARVRDPVRQLLRVSAVLGHGDKGRTIAPRCDGKLQKTGCARQLQVRRWRGARLTVRRADLVALHETIVYERLEDLLDGLRDWRARRSERNTTLPPRQSEELTDALHLRAQLLQLL